MNELVSVVKRGKRGSEAFVRDKLHASIVASCQSVRTPEAAAQHAADMVCDHVLKWTADKPEITSDDIRRQAGRALEQFQPDAAYVYQHYKVIM